MKGSQWTCKAADTNDKYSTMTLLTRSGGAYALPVSEVNMKVGGNVIDLVGQV